MLPALDINDDNDPHRGAYQQRENDKIFTEQIRDLFTILEKVERRAGERNRGKYQLTIYCPYQRYSGNWSDARDQAQWRIHLLEPETLPCLKSVVHLEIHNDQAGFERAKLDYRILIDLAARCPHLEYLECHLGGAEWSSSYYKKPSKLFIRTHDGPKRDTRHDMRSAIRTTTLPKSLRQVELDFLSREAMIEADNIHHWMATPNLTIPAQKDPFSASLRVLSYHLQIMRLRAQVDDTLFWPEDGSTPTWPHLKHVYIMFHMVSPSGKWYFEGPKGEGRESTGYDIEKARFPAGDAPEEVENLDMETPEEDGPSSGQSNHFWFRISPNEDTLVPLLASFAKAAANMPSLRQAILWSPLKWNVDGDVDAEHENVLFDYFELPKEFNSHFLAWGLGYFSRGEPTAFFKSPGEGKCNTRKMWWKAGKWRPNPELHYLFQQIGRREHGDEVEEYWDEEGFASRKYFDLWLPDA